MQYLGKHYVKKQVQKNGKSKKCLEILLFYVLTI